MQQTLLQEALQRSDWDQLEEAWLSLLEDNTPPQSELTSAGEALLDAGETKRAQNLLDLTYQTLLDRSAHADALIALRLLARIKPADEGLRAQVLDLYPKVHSKQPCLDEIIDRAQRNATTGALPLIENLDQLLKFQIGTYVEDAKGWGYGVVRAVDFRRMQVTIDFEEQKDHVIPIESAVEFIDVKDPDHFHCRLLADRASLEREAAEDPGALILRFLRSHGIPAPLRVIRGAIAGVLVPEKEWSKLWNRAKKSLIHNPYVEMTGSSQPTLSLRKSALSREDEVRAGVRNARRTKGIIKLVRAYLAEPATEGRPEFLVELAATLHELALAEKEAGAAVELEYLRADVAKAAGSDEGNPEIQLLVQDTREFAWRMSGVRTREYAVTFVRDLIAAKPEGWHRAAAQLLETADVHSSARDVADKACVEGEARTERDAAITRLFDRPAAKPEPFFWVSMRAFEDKIDLTGIPGSDPIELLEKHLDLVGRLGAATSFDSSSVTKTLARNARKAITEDLITRLVSSCDASHARCMAMAIARNNELESDFKAICRSIIVEHHPEAAAALATPEKDDDVIWTSAAGLTKRQKEYQHLLNVEIRNNGIALGKARELGDLSENAEWDAAREEERRLINKQKKMAEELGKAKAVEFGSGDAPVVKVGVCAAVRDTDSGKEASYIILGPWDVDPLNGVISYMSPLGQGLLGRKAGEKFEVTLPSGGTSQLELLESVWSEAPRAD